MKLQKLSAVFRHVKQIAMEGVCRTQLVCSPDHSPDNLINVLFSREISAVSFWDPIGPWPLLVNEISLDKFSCLVRVIRELDSGVWDVLFSSATLRKKSGIAMCDNFHLSQTPPPLHFQHLDKHLCTIPSPALFNRVPSQHVWPHMQWAEHRAF